MRSLLPALFLLTLPIHALADVPPPPGYVESCTASRQSRPGRECRECPSYHANPPGYCASQVGEGFTLACRTRGASAWTEVWCKDSSAPAPSGQTDTPPAPTPSEPAMTEPAAQPAMDEPAPQTAMAEPAQPAAQSSRRGCSAAGSAPDFALGGVMLLLGLLVSRRR